MKTIKAALAKLIPPLLFGDTEQIEAVKFVSEVEECREKLKHCACEVECDECDGTGIHECDCGDEHHCQFCNGTGADRFNCSCVEGFSEQVILEARS